MNRINLKMTVCLFLAANALSIHGMFTTRFRLVPVGRQAGLGYATGAIPGKVVLVDQPETSLVTEQAAVESVKSMKPTTIQPAEIGFLARVSRWWKRIPQLAQPQISPVRPEDRITGRQITQEPVKTSALFSEKIRELAATERYESDLAIRTHQLRKLLSRQEANLERARTQQEAYIIMGRIKNINWELADTQSRREALRNRFSPEEE